MRMKKSVSEERGRSKRQGCAHKRGKRDPEPTGATIVVTQSTIARRALLKQLTFVYPRLPSCTDAEQHLDLGRSNIVKSGGKKRNWRWKAREVPKGELRGKMT
jgi:hypothetical protein